MSSASPIKSEAFAPLHRVAAPFRTVCLPAAQFVGFWTAVLLPFVLASMLVTGLVVQFPLLVGALLGCNVAGLALGRNYNR